MCIFQFQAISVKKFTHKNSEIRDNSSCIHANSVHKPGSITDGITLRFIFKMSEDI